MKSFSQKGRVFPKNEGNFPKNDDFPQKHINSSPKTKKIPKNEAFNRGFWENPQKGRCFWEATSKNKKGDARCEREISREGAKRGDSQSLMRFVRPMTKCNP